MFSLGRMPFTPPPEAKQSAIKPDDGWFSCGFLALDKWRTENGLVYRALAEQLGCGAGTISSWKDGRLPNSLTMPRIEALTGIPREAWTWWVDQSPETNEHHSSPPPSGEQPKSTGPLGSTRDELDSTIRQIDAALRGRVTEGQRVQLLGKRASALMSRARLEERQAIVDHPDFAPLVEDLVAAVRSVFGPDAPDGLEARLADELERLQAARAASPDRRAA